MRGIKSQKEKITNSKKKEKYDASIRELNPQRLNTINTMFL
jgi:hypothetical protein